MKKYISLILIAVLFTALGVAIHCCYINLDINSAEETEEIKYNYTQYTVVRKTFEDNMTYEGKILVSDGEEYIDEYVLECDKDGYINQCVKKGEIVENGQALGECMCDGKIETVINKAYGKVVNISKISDYSILIKVLAYEKLHFTCSMEYSDLKKIDYDTMVYYRLNSGKKVQCQIDFIGYEIDDDGKVEVNVIPKSCKKYMPGEKRNFYFVLHKEEECLSVKNTAVVNQNGCSTVFVETGENEYEEKEIKVGKLLEYREDDHVFYYYKILSGLKEGDKVYSRKVAVTSNESD